MDAQAFCGSMWRSECGLYIGKDSAINAQAFCGSMWRSECGLYKGKDKVMDAQVFCGSNWRSHCRLFVGFWWVMEKQVYCGSICGQFVGQNLRFLQPISQIFKMQAIWRSRFCLCRFFVAATFKLMIARFSKIKPSIWPTKNPLSQKCRFFVGPIFVGSKFRYKGGFFNSRFYNRSNLCCF